MTSLWRRLKGYRLLILAGVMTLAEGAAAFVLRVLAQRGGRG